jgi:hypothetical protein
MLPIWYFEARVDKGEVEEVGEPISMSWRWKSAGMVDCDIGGVGLYLFLTRIETEVGLDNRLFVEQLQFAILDVRTLCLDLFRNQPVGKRPAWFHLPQGWTFPSSITNSQLSFYEIPNDGFDVLEM